jgi:hypothetical protein
MLYRNASIFAFACMLGVVGCRDNGTLTPADLSMAGGGGGGGGGGGTGGGDMATAGKTYTMATIAAMRGGAPGDYELDNVVAIALTPSSKSPHLVVQDAVGGDFSAISMSCSSSSTSHPCTVATTVHTITIGHKVTVQGTYIKAKLASGGTESFYIDMITDNGAGTAPAALTKDETEIERAVDTSVAGWNKDFWQMVTVTPTEVLNMYDWTPTDLKYSGTWPGCTTAPFVFGFGMLPASGGAAGTAACTTKTAPATSNATANAKEILIGTDYYKNFTVSSDCQCATTPTTVPAAATTWPMGMAMSGILGYDAPIGSATGYKYFSPIPATAGAGALTGTVAPPTM